MPQDISNLFTKKLGIEQMMTRIKQLDEELKQQTELNKNVMKQMRKMEF